MTIRRRNVFGFASAFSCLFSFAASAQLGLSRAEVTLVDDDATQYATFQSHNQKVVSNQYGIFMTHIRKRNDAYTAQWWRLSRSTDSGATFDTIYEATHATNPPAIETDEDGNIYLIRCEYENEWNAYLYHFPAENSFRNPEITAIPNGSAGKYAAFFDAARRQIYYFAHNGYFFVLGLDGSVKSSTLLLTAGADAARQYPLLSMGTDGTLYTAWTTQQHGVYMYWSIHFMKSLNAGTSWQTLNGTPLNTPIIDDPGGPTDEVTFNEEHEYHTWLSNFMAKDGKLHFIYMAQIPPAPYPERYIRYDVASAKRDVYLTPTFGGEELRIAGLDGFFVSEPSVPGSTLYAIGAEQGGYQRIICLASDDNGVSWYDYCRSELAYPGLYSIGGYRRLTANRNIIGSFTKSAGTPEVHFLKIQAGLSKADVASIERIGETVVVAFENVRGNPVEIRFRPQGGEWNLWQPFQTTIDLLDDSMAFYQLRSNIGVESAESSLPEIPSDSDTYWRVY